MAQAPESVQTREYAEKALTVAVTDGLTGEAESLYKALQVAKQPMANPLDVQVEALATLGWWLPVAEDKRAKATGIMKLAFRLYERQLEGLLRALDKGIIARMHQNNMAERTYHRNG